MSEKVILTLERVIVTIAFLAFFSVLLLSGHVPNLILEVIPSVLVLIAGAWFTAHSVANGSTNNNVKQNVTNAAEDFVNTCDKEYSKTPNMERIPPGMGG